jgi:hypothetical protein
MKNTISGILVIALIISLVSCQKNISSPNPTLVPTNIFGFTDSSQLIKSIAYHNQDSSGSQYFFYDTVNRKIIVSLQPVTTIGGDYSDGQEFSYDGFGMLTHITGKFSGTNDSYFTSADYYYDNQHVLDSVNTAIPGINYAEGYTKTLVSGGYLLSALYTSPSVNGFTDSNYTAALIDDSGRLRAFYTVYNNTEPGDPQNTSPNGDTYFYFTDSVMYDAAGNKSRYTMRYPPDMMKPDSLVTVVLYDYGVRDVMGDQLHKLGVTLFRGVSELPFSIIDFFAGELTPLGEVGMQIYKYPSLSTTMTVADSTGIYNTTLQFSTAAQYDDQQRLISYHNFAHYPPYAPYEITIVYYK